MGGMMSSSNDKKRSAPAAAANDVKITDIDRTILDLKNTRDKLQKQCKQLEERDIPQLLERAKAAKQKGLTSTAMNLLKLKKYKQTQLSSCQEQLLKVHQMVETIHSQQQTNVVLQVLAQGKDQLKQMHKETPIDNVLELMDQVQEENELEQQYNDILKDNVPTLSVEQESQVEQELQALMDEMNANAAVETDIALPEAPTNKLPELQEPEQPEPVKEERQAVLA